MQSHGKLCLVIILLIPTRVSKKTITQTSISKPNTSGRFFDPDDAHSEAKTVLALQRRDRGFKPLKSSGNYISHLP